MELTHLKNFVAVAEELHFGRAARRLHISQPPLSQQIMKLEDELGVKLFKRSSRVVELTGAGKVFLEEARSILNRTQMMSERMARLAAGRGGVLAVGFNEPVLNTILPQAVNSFRRRYPEVELKLFEMETAAQLVMLQNQEIDLALLRAFGDNHAGVATRLLYREAYLLALPAEHPLLEREIVPVAKLQNQELVMFSRRSNPAVYDDVLEALRSAGVDPLIRQEAGSKATMLSLIRAGLGIGIVPESSRLTAPPGIEFRPLGPGLPMVEIMAAWSEGNSSAPLRNFLELCACHEVSCRQRL